MIPLRLRSNLNTLSHLFLYNLKIMAFKYFVGRGIQYPLQCHHCGGSVHPNNVNGNTLSELSKIENRHLRNQLVDEKQKFLKHTLKEVGKDSDSTTVEELKTDSSSDEGREIPFSSDIGTDDSNLYCMKNPPMKKIKRERKLMRIPIMELEGMSL